MLNIKYLHIVSHDILIQIYELTEISVIFFILLTRYYRWIRKLHYGHTTVTTKESESKPFCL